MFLLRAAHNTCFSQGLGTNMPPLANLAALQRELLAERALIEAELGIPTGAALVTGARGRATRKRARNASRSPSTHVPAPSRVSLRVRGVQAGNSTKASTMGTGAGAGSAGDSTDNTRALVARQRRGGDELPPRLGRPSSAAVIARRAERAAAAAGSAADLVVVPPSSAVAASDGAAAVPLSASTLLKATVVRDTQIRAFVEGNLGVPFFAGRSYHEFVEKTSVYTTEGWVIEDSRSGDVFEGGEAFAAAGFARVVKARAPPRLPAHMRLYLLSRSHGRMLRAGQRFIYKLVEA